MSATGSRYWATLARVVRAVPHGDASASQAVGRALAVRKFDVDQFEGVWKRFSFRAASRPCSCSRAVQPPSDRVGGKEQLVAEPEPRPSMQPIVVHPHLVFFRKNEETRAGRGPWRSAYSTASALSPRPEPRPKWMTQQIRAKPWSG